VVGSLATLATACLGRCWNRRRGGAAAGGVEGEDSVDSQQPPTHSVSLGSGNADLDYRELHSDDGQRTPRASLREGGLDGYAVSSPGNIQSLIEGGLSSSRTSLSQKLSRRPSEVSLSSRAHSVAHDEESGSSREHSVNYASPSAGGPARPPGMASPSTLHSVNPGSPASLGGIN
jgi:hypothetical protein